MGFFKSFFLRIKEPVKYRLASMILYVIAVFLSMALVACGTIWDISTKGSIGQCPSGPNGNVPCQVTGIIA